MNSKYKTLKAGVNSAMEKRTLTALEVYINRVYVMVLLLIPGTCMMAGLGYTANKIQGFFDRVSWPELILFDSSCLVYLAIGIFFIMTGKRWTGTGIKVKAK